jgi:hypothetical protein
MDTELEMMWKEAVMTPEVYSTSMLPNLLLFNNSESVNGIVSNGILSVLYCHTFKLCTRLCRSFPLQQPRFNHRSGHAGFVVEKCPQILILPSAPHSSTINQV